MTFSDITNRGKLCHRPSDESTATAKSRDDLCCDRYVNGTYPFCRLYYVSAATASPPESVPNMNLLLNRSFGGLLSVAALTAFVGTAVAAPPQVGDTAPDFTLNALDGKKVTLSQMLKKGTVTLVVLRGFPGYQCPVCTMQVGELKSNSDKFAAAKSPVILVYPGPSKELQQRASEFVTGKDLPKNFTLVIDPDYTFVNSYRLRWDAPGETAYPSTFVINKAGKIVFAKTSMSHGGRTKSSEILAAIPPK